MTTPFYPSASAVALYQLCNARALGSYVAGIKEPESPQSKEGTRLHALGRLWLAKGEKPKPGTEPAIQKLIGALPVPGGSIKWSDTERVMTMPTWFGYMDWTTSDGRQGDLKFSGSVDYQRKKDPTKDVQRITYALDEFYRDPFLRTLKQTWNVTMFNGSRAIALEHEWTREAAKAAYEKNLAKDVDKFQEAVLNKRNWMDAAKNFEACDTYRPNGCPMKGLGCKPTLKQRLAVLRPSRIKV